MEFVQDGTNNSYVQPVPKGPTSIPQTMSFYMNKNGGSDLGTYFQRQEDPITVTVSLDDQQFLNVPQHITGLTFGAVSGASSSQVKSSLVVNSNYFYNDTSRTIFTAHPQGPAGQGLHFNTNPGIQIFISTKPLSAIDAPTSDTSRYYYGKLRLHFSRTVKDPVVSLVGLGATTSFDNKRLGFATELELMTPSLTLTKLSGNEQLILDPTRTKILHTKTAVSGGCNFGAACGSVVVNGSKIRDLVFDVYIRPDGREGKWGTKKVTNSGDMWHLILSMPEQ